MAGKKNIAPADLAPTGERQGIMFRFSKFAAALIAATSLGLASSALAVVTYNTNVDVYDTTGPEFISGDGILINGFVQDSLSPVASENTISVALKARDRDTGQANGIVNNVYYVDPGYSSTTPAITNLAIDFQFDPGINSGSPNYVLRQSIDFDPAVGSTDFAVITLPIYDADGIPDATLDSWAETDGYFTNPGAGAWSDDTVPYVISNSTRMDFSFWSGVFGKSYDPNALGEYELRLEVLDPTATSVLASSTALAVVPEPSAIGLLGVGAIALLSRRPRRK